MRLDIKLTKLIFRVAVSDKGWTDNEISVNWHRFFDDVTKEKVSGQYHLLVVDGHASHYCLKFIEYAQKHKIVILCYPAHAMDVLQGLDVIIFAILKEAFAIECDKCNERHWPVKVTKMSVNSRECMGRHNHKYPHKHQFLCHQCLPSQCCCHSS